MEPKFMISEVFSTSWKYTKSQIWVLVGLFIGYFILSSIISMFGKEFVPDNGWRRATVFRLWTAIP